MTSDLTRYGAGAYATVFDYLALTDEVRPSDAIVCFGSRDLHGEHPVDAPGQLSTAAGVV